MKAAKKYVLYLSIPLLLIVAFVIYNSYFGKAETGSSLKESKAKNENNRQRGGDFKSLPVSVYIADYHQSEAELAGPGTLVSNDKVEMASELSGRVVGINFKEGQFVKKGDILVKLNDDELQSQLTRAEYQYTLLEEKLERQKILLSKEAVSREDYDQVSTEFNVLKQDIEQLRIKIEKMKIRAPFDGVIGFRDISLGALLLPSSKVATIVDLANLILEFSIPEKYVSSNLMGSKVEFTVGGISKRFKAVVYAIDPEIDVETRSITLRARYYNKGGILRPGMFARFYLTPEKEAPSIYLPNEAVVANVKGRSVWILRGGKAKMMEVQTGTRSVDMMEILSGVEKGDTIITTGLMQLREGISITPTNI
ncbi:MAG: efflux RND transporter periplasmic adaptor subunit [Bacteroidales bacterium]